MLTLIGVCFVLSGITIFFLTICEPLVYMEIEKSARRIFKINSKRRRKQRKNKTSFSGQSLEHFLNSAINVEFVSIILQGVTKMMKLHIEEEERQSKL